MKLRIMNLLIYNNFKSKEGIQMPKVKVGKLNIYYEIRGKGEPLIILQGLGIKIFLL